jgi:hypothetical protein
MGVDFNVGGKSVGAHWSYSGFNEFRHKLAAAIGIDLDQMEGFGGKYEPIPMPSLADVLEGKAEMPSEEDIRQMALERAEKYVASQGKTSWDTINDPLKPLLHHSDCDGDLTPEECAQVAPRLKEIVTGWDDKWKLTINPEFREKMPHYPETMEMDNYDKTNALKLVEGMQEAVRLGVPLEFC